MARADLLAAIAADLDDDGPRLVYADELQAAGDARGELIAVQCELARLGVSRLREDDWVGDFVVDTDVTRLRTRESALLAAHGAAWDTELAGLSWESRHRYVRGFVEHVMIWPEPDLVRRVFATIPTVRSLGLMMKSDDSARHALTSCDELQQVRRIAIGWGDDDQLQAAFESPHLLGVRELAFADRSHLQVSRATFEAMTRAPWLRDVEVLELASVMSPERLVGIVESAPALRELHATGFDDDEVELAEQLAGCEALATLHVLDMRSSGLDSIGVAALASTARELRALRLAGNLVGAPGAKHIGEAFPALRVLDLSGNRLELKGWQSLSSGKGLGALRDLRLAKTTRTGDASLRALVESPLLEWLRSLDLRNNDITDAGLDVLAASSNCRNLTALDIRQNTKITRRGLDVLDASPHLARCAIQKPKPKGGGAHKSRRK